MRSAQYWFVLGVHVVTGVVMMFIGALFFRRICVSLWMSDGLIVVPSLLFGVTLYMVGGGILFSTLIRLSKGLWRKSTA
ncbi:MAG: hypothetical protein ABSD38_18305 [Syntrophorhabdales bacterium]|jgi:hypothetical protein